MSLSIQPSAPLPGGPEDRRFGALRDPRAFVRVFVGVFFRDLESFFPGCRVEALDTDAPARPGFPRTRSRPGGGMDFRMTVEGAREGREQGVAVALFGSWYRIVADGPIGLGEEDLRLIRAMGSVLDLNYQILFRRSRMSILQLLRGMPEDHYVAACLEPSAYAPAASAPSRVAEAILTLRTMALSTYENRRVTTGALILGPSPVADESAAPPGALAFGVELTSLKSLHRLCDGRRTLFLIDRDGRMADVVDVRRWVDRDGKAGCSEPADGGLEVPCARLYQAHARATRAGGHVCLVLSPHQEIKVFAGGMQTFVFAHGRWRVLDPASKFALWRESLSDPRLARVLFQTALELAEERKGGLLVVVPVPAEVIGRLIAPEDVLDYRRDDQEDASEPTSIEPDGPTLHVVDGDRLPGDVPPSFAIPGFRGPGAGRGESPSKRSIHYLADGRSLLTLDPSVVEALASLDGALAVDGEGRLLAFGAILRHSLSPPGDGHRNPSRDTAEGARTTAAIVASRFGPVLKISEDGIVSCFLDGERVWDL